MNPSERSDVPVWLLDIDGVVNVVAEKPYPSVWPKSAWQRAHADVDGIRYPLLVAAPVVDFVSEVHATGSAQVRWHTTWQQHAVHTFGPLFGFPELAVEHAPEFGAPPRPRAATGGAPPVSAWWKLAAAERVVAEQQRALLWTDDDLGYAVQTLGLGAVQECADCLLISPRTDHGLTPEHLERIRAFLGM